MRESQTQVIHNNNKKTSLNDSLIFFINFKSNGSVSFNIKYVTEQKILQSVSQYRKHLINESHMVKSRTSHIYEHLLFTITLRCFELFDCCM